MKGQMERDGEGQGLRIFLDWTLQALQGRLPRFGRGLDEGRFGRSLGELVS